MPPIQIPRCPNAKGWRATLCFCTLPLDHDGPCGWGESFADRLRVLSNDPRPVGGIEQAWCKHCDVSLGVSLTEHAKDCPYPGEQMRLMQGVVNS